MTANLQRPDKTLLIPRENPAFRKALVVAMILVAVPQPARALIFYSTGDPSHNVTDPGDGSGWQWEIQYGSVLATAIAPEYMITARHVGGAPGAVVSFQGQTYTTTAAWNSPNSDLTLMKVDHPFPTWAPLYQGSDEAGKTLTVFGRGTLRGDEVDVPGASPTANRGWLWGSTDFQTRWGQNVVSAIEDASAQGLGSLLGADFDRVSTPGDTTTAGGLPDEVTLSNGDSGGGVFIQENGTWKLAGINYGVVTGWRFTPTDGSSFQAAVFDAGGLYLDGFGSIPDAVKDIPAEWVATRISSNVEWINSIVGVPETPVSLPGLISLLSIAGLAAYQRCRR